MSQSLKTGHSLVGAVRMKGLLLQVEENSSGERFPNLGMAFPDGILVVNGTREV